MLPYSGDSEDACQEALLNIATKIGSWSGQGRFTTWMHVVALNSARTTYRKLKNQAVPTDFEGGHHDRPDPRTTSVIAGTRLDLLEAMETIEKDHPQYVEPLLLRDVYGMAYDDIAQLIGRAARDREGADPPRPEARATAAAGRVMRRASLVSARAGRGLLDRRCSALCLLAGCSSTPSPRST